jgi:hypothetical protein
MTTDLHSIEPTGEGPDVERLAAHAILAARQGDHDRASAKLAAARSLSRSTRRRDRQLLEIASFAVAGSWARAFDLALEHRVDFPDDTTLLTFVTR